MADFVNNSQINLSINGRQANMVLDTMRQKAAQLEQAMHKAAAAGDTKKAKQFAQQLRQVNDIIRQSQSEATALEEVMRRLDKASPKELRNTLNILQRQMATMRRGTKEWEEQAAKIRRVKEEMQRLNQAMNVQQTTWQRFNRWLNDSQIALMGLIGALTGFIAAGKQAVQKYADIEQEMANVRKFTGMTADEVERLNQEFQKINTRTSREDLNKLAQEAGRLGKTSEQDVLGFVRAADKINVALDDLGDGATLTLSKLTGIFGDEERYGTEQSLLKVGSVINELSQNCSASAPYIANFTERLGGVGAQAGMTIQQIMAFAAVLDSNSQKVEASATALSQVIVRLYQDPAKYARVAGLDVKKFSDLMRKDANEALILFLETLQKAGGMDVLSPMFKDMGENGARAIAALSTLATNIQAVKDQQKVANQAFREGTSVINEFEVQNNTVQAGMDKAKKQITEIAVELGQKLMPVVSHIYSSSSIFLRMMSQMVTFLSDNYKAIFTLTAAIVAYNVAINLSAIRTKAFTAAQTAAMAITKAWPKVLLLWDAAILLVNRDIKLATRALGLFSKAILTNPLGLLIATISAAVMAFEKFRREVSQFPKAMDKAMESSLSFAEATRKEQSEIDKLFGTLEAAKKGTEAYDKAKDEIISKYGVYLQGIINEAGEITNLTLAYERLSFAARKSAESRGLAKARANVDEAYYSEVDDLTEKLRSSLSQMGMSDRDVTRLVLSVSQGITTGDGISDDTFREIMKFTEDNLSIRQNLFGDSPVSIMRKLRENKAEHASRTEKLDGMDNRFFRDMTYETLDKSIEEISQKLNTIPANEIEVSFKLRGDKELENLSNTISSKYESPEFRAEAVPAPMLDAGFNVSGVLTRDQAEDLLRELLYEKSQRPDYSNKENQGSQGSAPLDQSKSTGDPFAKALKELQLRKEEQLEKAAVEYAAGITDYLQYLNAKHDAEIKYYDDSDNLYKSWSRTQDDGYRQLLVRRSAYDRSWKEQNTAQSLEEVKRWQKQQEIELRLEYSEKGALSEQEEKNLQTRLFFIKIQALQKELSLYNKGSKEYQQKSEEIEQELAENKLKIRSGIAKKIADFEEKYTQQSPAKKLKDQLIALKALINTDWITKSQYNKLSKQAIENSKKDLPGAPKKSEADQAREQYEKDKATLDQWLKEGLISQKEYAERMRRIQSDLNRSLLSGLQQCGSEWVQQLTNMYQAWADFAEYIKSGEGDPFQALSSGIMATAAIMQSVMQSVTQLTQAEVEIQTAAIERRYARESAFAEGNAYLQSRLEKKKEKEIAKLKSDAAKKNFAMQVASTVASTAANAVSAYGAALQVGGLAGLILAPVAAAMALAQGAIQIAVLKKQQQTASAGYSEGGFTKKGRKDEPAGIVHAGEWVASQKLVNNPKIRPVIDILEYAQRTNTVASLSMEDVSRSISAPMALSVAQQGQSQQQPQVVTIQQTGQDNTALTEAIGRLNERLDKPFITQNTVDGPLGIKQAQAEYARLMANKSK